ncbi:hypothetical protein KIY57_13425 [Heyndrickxia coagulans]|jgi:hypothetical protein|nr:hypothetical protein [Heyndrickxia coagulans]MBT2237067.1 hypothetical protein [Heyndrickxia coagulans]NWN94911.1 hypothetical protein [Bacillus sp. (in: firmicutes)]QWU06179.1 hypothetical protein KNH48_11770 [Heyndrickxia coagulans]WNE60903.1 hypothetical protein KIY57_13425 [Heyndrickxia coagulans]
MEIYFLKSITAMTAVINDMQSARRPKITATIFNVLSGRFQPISSKTGLTVTARIKNISATIKIAYLLTNYPISFQAKYKRTLPIKFTINTVINSIRAKIFLNGLNKNIYKPNNPKVLTGNKNG